MTQHTESGISRRRFLGTAAAGAALVSMRSGGEEASGDFCFCVMADPHCAEGPKPGIDHLGTALDKCMRCFAAMADLPPEQQPEFVLIVGDVHPEKLRERLAEAPFPIHAVAGNHESTPARRNALCELFPEDLMAAGAPRDYFSFVHRGVRFIGLCNAGMGGEHFGHFSSELIRPSGQCAWFEQEMAAPEARKVVFAHIPPEPDSADRNMYIAPNDNRWFLDAVGRGKPEAMFFGHLHQATHEHAYGATRSINLRSCCWNGDRTPLGFLHVTVTSSGMKTREIFTGEYK